MHSFNEKLCLQWSDFHDNIKSSFRELRNDKDFSDVTLACDDGQRVEVHRFVLISSSPFFSNLLKQSKRSSHHIIYMRGIKSDIVVAMADFLYHGETEVCQENLNPFLALAAELQLKGLRASTEVGLVETSSDQARMIANKNTTVDQEYPTDDSGRNGMKVVKNETIAVLNGDSGAAYLEELHQKVKSMMKFSNNSIHGKRTRICNVCGKEGDYTTITNHIEANHLSGLPIPCHLCGTIAKTRAALRVHKGTYHKPQ